MVSGQKLTKNRFLENVSVRDSFLAHKSSQTPISNGKRGLQMNHPTEKLPRSLGVLPPGRRHHILPKCTWTATESQASGPQDSDPVRRLLTEIFSHAPQISVWAFASSSHFLFLSLEISSVFVVLFYPHHVPSSSNHFSFPDIPWVHLCRRIFPLSGAKDRIRTQDWQ